MQAEPGTDDALIAASRRGDRAAFAQLVERYQRTIYGVAFAATRNRALADDVTQDTFVTAWCRLGDLRDDTRLPAWLCGIARNRARDAYKRGRREQLGDAPEQAAHGTPFDALADAEAERLLATALGDVPEVYREPLVLFYFEDQSVEDVARTLGLSAHTTNKRLSRGRQRLAERVESLDRQLTSRGPRAGLVATVLASIGALGSASHVDASPAATKGSIMPRLALASVLVASLGGGVLLLSTSVASPPSRPAPRVTPAPAAPAAATVAPAARATPRVTPPTVTTAGSAAGAPAHRAPAPPRLPATATTIPDCAAVATHLAAMTLARFTSAKALPQAKRDQFMALRSADLTKRCTEERWSDDRRVCALSAADSDDELACREDTIATTEEVASAPRELQCDVIAQHLADLSTAPGGKFALVQVKMAERGLPFDMAQVATQVRDQERDRCERIPWSIKIRTCVAAAATYNDSTRCW